MADQLNSSPLSSTLHLSPSFLFLVWSYFLFQTRLPCSTFVQSGQYLFKVIRGIEVGKVYIFDVVILMCSIYLHLELNLASSIVVIESRGLVESVRKSSSLMKGNKLLGLMLLLIFGTPSLVLGMFSYWILEVQLSLKGDLSHGGWWTMVTYEFVLKIVIVSVLFMLVLLLNTLCNVILYLHCIKAEQNDGEHSAE